MDDSKDVGYVAKAINSLTQPRFSSIVNQLLFETPGGSSSNKRPIEEHDNTINNALLKTTTPRSWDQNDCSCSQAAPLRRNAKRELREGDEVTNGERKQQLASCSEASSSSVTSVAVFR
ncbi:Uncharacterized protein Fot_20345 [Forsythia ovata]|uniref:Uncharacterized protein n=1 Tax=Forsythia ovata TaxID=205694 RepID=A0ABD1VNM7_9LAMI